MILLAEHLPPPAYLQNQATPIPAPPTPGELMDRAARALVAATTDNAYAYTPTIDPARGVFHADCSDLIDYLAPRAREDALLRLPHDPGHAAPRAWNFYSYFMAQPLATEPPRGAWGRVGKPAQLEPGDVIAWKNARYVPHQSSTGHVMLVDGLPREVKKPGGEVAGYDVPVIDATAHGHGPADPRKKGHGGIGRGTIYLPVGRGGEVTGFSWDPAGTPGAPPPREPTIAFGRLLPDMHISFPGDLPQ